MIPFVCHVQRGKSIDLGVDQWFPAGCGHDSRMETDEWVWDFFGGSGNVLGLSSWTVNYGKV